MNIGILAIQGSVIEHKTALQKLGVEVIEVRRSDDLKNLDGIILPGGESATQSKLLRRSGLFDDLKKRIEGGLPAWGTCAGAILLAKKVTGKNPPSTLGVMDIEANRNAYGRQLDSFEAKLMVQMNPHPKKIKGVFIRAPKLKPKADVQRLANCKNDVVMLRQNHMLATSFHPELTDDVSIHLYFVKMCK